MAEYIRSVKVHVEVDTNKQTYVLHLDDTDLGEIQERVTDFVDGLDL